MVAIAGEHFRQDTNQMNLQPIAAIFFREGWSLGYSGRTRELERAV